VIKENLELGGRGGEGKGVRAASTYASEGR